MIIMHVDTAEFSQNSSEAVAIPQLYDAALFLLKAKEETIISQRALCDLMDDVIEIYKIL